MPYYWKFYDFFHFWQTKSLGAWLSNCFALLNDSVWMQYSVFGSILTFGAMIGAITSGPIADFIGRKGVSNCWSWLFYWDQDHAYIMKSFKIILFFFVEFIDCGIHAGIESVCCCLRCRMACYLLCWGSDISLFEVICAYNYKANPFYQKLDLIIFSTSWLTIGGFSFGHWKTGNRIWNGCLFLCGAYLFIFLKINTSYLI